ncbi:MAG: hypothetical protein ACR2KE_05855 [Candidatus Nanopelagicales bacterium]
MQPARRDNQADPYAWMRHPSTEMTAHLAAERADYDRRMSPMDTAPILAELRARTPDAERTVSRDHGPYAYYTVTRPGRELAELRRSRDGREETLLDLGSFGSPYAATGVVEPSPDDRLLAYSVDLTGAEVYALRFRDLDSGKDLPLEVPETYYTGAWADERTFFYTVPDDLNRPHEVWRIDIETGERHVVLTEPDQHFELQVHRSRSGAWIVITAMSRSTTETWAVPASDPSTAPVSLRGRRHGVEYFAEHDGDRWLFLTNEAHPEFSVVGSDGWALDRPGERIHDVLAYADYLVTESRANGEGRIRVLDREGSVQFELGPDEPGGSIRLGHNDRADSAFVTIVTESFTTPTAWWDVDLRTGERTLRHRRDVPGHDPTAYVSEVVTATAADGWQVPVVVTRLRGVPLDGSAPCVL